MGSFQRSDHKFRLREPGKSFSWAIFWVFLLLVLSGCSATNTRISTLKSFQPALPPETEIRVLYLPVESSSLFEFSPADSVQAIAAGLSEERQLAEWKKQLEQRHPLDFENRDTHQLGNHEIIGELTCTSDGLDPEKCIESLKEQARLLGANAIIIQKVDFDSHMVPSFSNNLRGEYTSWTTTKVTCLAVHEWRKNVPPDHRGQDP